MENNEKMPVEGVKDSIETSTKKVKKKSKKNKKLDNFKEKCRDLVKDKRPWYKRLITAVVVSLAFAYTLIVFGPLEMFIPNMGFYPFALGDLLKPLILLGVGVFAALTVFLFIFRGRLFNYLTTVVFSTTVCAYIQCNMMNDLSALDGTAIKWDTMAISMLANVAVWAVIFIIPFIVHYFNRKFWRKAVTFLAAALIAIQSVGLVQIIVMTDFVYADGTGYLSNKEIYKVSDKKNVVMFLLDRCDYATLQKTFAKYPDLEGNLKDFICYDNASGSYSRTFPSVAYLLTGVKQNYDSPVDTYFGKAWTEGQFLKDVKNAGYNTRLYTEVNYVIKNTAYIEDIVDNIGEERIVPDTKEMLSIMMNLSMYRYSPLSMKPFFWAYTGDFEAVNNSSEDHFSDVHTTNDAMFYGNLVEQGLSVDSESNGEFVFYHMRGAHEPFQMDENGNFTYVSSSEQQLAGNLRMIFNYVSQLKEKGLYDDTTIIVTADHGLTGTVQKLEYPRTISLLVKPAGEASGLPMQYNSAPVCHDNIRSYVLKCLGIDYSSYEPAIDDIAEDAQVTRYFYMSAADELLLHRDHKLITYKIEGNVHDINSWSFVEEIDIEYPFYDAN